MMNEHIAVVVCLKRALLISHSEKGAALLGEIIKDEQYTDITVVGSADEARRLENCDNLDLICINAPLGDENGIELASEFALTTKASVVIIVPQKNADSIHDLLVEQGVLVVSKPINKQLFHRSLQFAECFKMRILRFSQENDSLKHMVEDIKIINRAKLLLITCLNMTEIQAHRYLEKQAMDLRISKLKVAKQVIQTYEN